jgi:uncharacterized protein (DUF433 family)
MYGFAAALSRRRAARYIGGMDGLSINRITIDPALCNGKPTIRGRRITVQTVLEYLGAGESQEEILWQFPMLEPENYCRLLEFCAPEMKSF